MGEFDKKCSGAVRKAKNHYPALEIRLILVLPYMMNKLNKEKVQYEGLYDEILIPAELCGAHYRAAIPKRNRWLVEQSDYLIAYVRRDYGGAFATMKHAGKLGKKIVNLAIEK